MTKITQVDAFTNEPFRGNPAGVCVLEKWPADDWMQAVAAEMNLSETAFLVAEEGGYGLRWFTPAVEVDLCGHATLASAHVLWEEGHLAAGAQVQFHTRSGRLTARQDGAWITLDFPALPPREIEPPPGLVEALGATPVCVAEVGYFFLAELECEAAVRALTPDFRVLAGLGKRTIVTARGEGGSDFVSRFFAPGAGVDEDPVTGSAHCVLGPYWAARLGATEMLAVQVSRREGRVRVRLAGDRVLLSGQAVTTLRGELCC